MVWLALLVSAEARRPYNTANNAAVCWVRHDSKPRLYTGRTTLTYETGEQVAADETRRAQVEMRPPEATPVHGQLVFKVERSTIDSANAANQVIVVEGGGRELLRSDPKSSVWTIAETPGPNGYWWNVLVLPVPDDAEFPLTVHAADKVAVHRCSWAVRWDGAVRPAPPP